MHVSKELTDKGSIRYAQSISGARVVLIQRGEHHIHLSNPEEVLKEMTSFISSLPP